MVLEAKMVIMHLGGLTQLQNVSTQVPQLLILMGMETTKYSLEVVLLNMSVRAEGCIHMLQTVGNGFISLGTTT